MKAPMTLDLSTIGQLVAEALQARGVRADQSTFRVDPTRFLTENQQQPDGSWADVVVSLGATVEVIVDFHQAPDLSQTLSEARKECNDLLGKLQTEQGALVEAEAEARLLGRMVGEVRETLSSLQKELEDSALTENADNPSSGLLTHIHSELSHQLASLPEVAHG